MPEPIVIETPEEKKAMNDSLKSFIGGPDLFSTPAPAGAKVIEQKPVPASTVTETTPAAITEVPKGEGEGVQKTEDQNKDETLTPEEKKEKRDYYSNLGKLHAELAEKNRIIQEQKDKETALMLEKYKESGAVEDINKLIDIRMRERDTQEEGKEIARLEKLERDTFITSNPELKEEITAIENVRNQFPNMSYEAASKLHLATTNPALLVKKTGAYNPTNLNNASPSARSAGTDPDGLTQQEVNTGLRNFLLGN